MALRGPAAVLVLVFTFAACGASPSTPGPVGQSVNEALCRIVRATDADCDGVINALDRRPGIHDYGDADGDLIFNGLDLYHGQDDTRIDSDGDGVADYLDSYRGIDWQDDDRDGIANAVDTQPSVPLGAGQPTTAQDNRTVAELIVLNSMRADQMRELIDRGPDSDLDGFPDRIDTTPTEYTNDRDGDGSPDRYDPEPGIPWVTEKYDPWDPSGDAYYDDPYDPGSDAYWDDDNNGWGD